MIHLKLQPSTQTHSLSPLSKFMAGNNLQSTISVHGRTLYPTCKLLNSSKMLGFSLQSRTDRGLIVCSAVGHNTLNSDELGLRNPTRTSEILELIDQGEKTLANSGKFGRFGGIFVPETLITCLKKLEVEFNWVLHDPQFQVCFSFFQTKPLSGMVLLKIDLGSNIVCLQLNVQ